MGILGCISASFLETPAVEAIIFCVLLFRVPNTVWSGSRCFAVVVDIDQPDQMVLHVCGRCRGGHALHQFSVPYVGVMFLS